MLVEYVCMSSHGTERRVKKRDGAEPSLRCDECGGPAFLSQFGLFAVTRGRLSTETPLKDFHEAALEMEHVVTKTDDPAVKPLSRIYHAAKVRSEAQMLAGATRWTPEKAWNAREVD